MHFSVKEDIIQLTEKWDGERFPDGRPRVSDEDLEEIRHLTLEEVWQPMFMKGYLNQFEEKLKRLHEDKTKLVGRAVTCSFMPARPDLEEAVKICAEKANPGDAVLLSPACASWGQFDNYEQRGDMFKEYVRAL